MGIAQSAASPFPARLCAAESTASPVPARMGIVPSTRGTLDIRADLVEDGRRRTAIEIILRREAPAWGGLRHGEVALTALRGLG